MSEGSRGRKTGPKKHVLVQRPLRKYKQQRAANDEELARRLQNEEDEKMEGLRADQLLAQQISEQLNKEVTNHKLHLQGQNVSSGHDESDMHDDFARYRGMTQVDSMLARQLQLQEEETAIGRHMLRGDRAMGPEELLSTTRQDITDTRQMGVVGPPARVNFIFPQRAVPGQRGNVVRFSGPGPHHLGPIRRPNIALRRQRAVEVLPDGEEDPDMLSLTLGGGADADFLNIMRDPFLLVMALSRGAHFSGIEDNIDLEDYDSLWELAERLGEVQRKGVSEQVLDSLPTHSHQDGASSSAQSKNCQVCLSDFEQGETIRALPCFHEYHCQCIDEWLKRNATCPICRKGVSP